MATYKSSSIWLGNGNNSPRNEGLACFLQDLNIFFFSEELVSRCPHCKAAKKTVDHLATRCERMLYLDYTRRHNEGVRCLHLHFCRLYGLKNQKRLKTHSVQEVISNERVEVRVDTRIETDSTVRYNKPDLLVYDKKENVIWIVEVGVTSQDNLQRVELEKLRKYDLLANELSLIHKAKVNIIPVVLAWDGIVSKYFKKYLDSIRVREHLIAYMQSIALKRTMESTVLDFRSGLSQMDYEARVEEVLSIYEEANGIGDQEIAVRRLVEDAYHVPFLDGSKRVKIDESVNPGMIDREDSGARRVDSEG
ncbi:uncharacterized protein LOC115231549 [Octopus sinensis]|uniref:Uncharacterized protein LOC115231549 n=1 Tax=Octopus sinensis TaxID=2607531 RepID=A0A6P7U8W8_9MOLL|nr:uncharacterized protein LOC115231549 [Octopus sinensis]